MKRTSANAAIYKYTISERTGRVTIPMPRNAVIISAAEQYDKIVIYAEVDALQPNVNRDFILVTTGSEIGVTASERQFIGTVMLSGKTFVAHVYEVTS